MPGASLDVDDLQRSLDRAYVYRTLAMLFRVPDEASVRETRERRLPELCAALERSSADAELLAEAGALGELLRSASAAELRRQHEAAFDESSKARCAPTEMDQLGGPPQLELTRTFELADVAGFYRAFGVEVEEGGERVDHIAVELEFMHLLAAKECVALNDEGWGEHAETCRNASRAFLRDHLLRWAPRLGDQLAESLGSPLYARAGRLLGRFVLLDADQIDAAGAPVHRIPADDRAEPARTSQ